MGPTGGGEEKVRTASPFVGKLSPVAEARRPSRLRSLAPALAVEGMIWLAGGLPPRDVFPLTSVTLTTKYGDVVTVDDPQQVYSMQQYNIHAVGYPPLLKWFTEHTKEMHNPPNDAWKVLVTCGNSDGMAMVFEAMLGPGDVLLVEESNFAASMSTLCPVAARGVRIVPVPLEASDGSLSSSAMEEVVQKLKAEGAPPKMLYTVPTGQNPTGGTMTLAQLQAVYDVCCRHDIIVMEDDPYWYLQFPPADGGEAPGLDSLTPSFLSIDTEARVVRLDTLAKFIAPGIRGGWITCPDPLHSALVMATTQSSHGQSSLSSVMFHGLLSAWGREGLNRHLKLLQAEYGRRARLVLSEAEKQLKSLAEWIVPDAGMFIWVKVPGIEDTEALMPQLEAHKVVLVPGRYFSFDDAPSPFFRLCFTTASDDDLREGVRRLAVVLREAKERA